MNNGKVNFATKIMSPSIFLLYGKDGLVLKYRSSPTKDDEVIPTFQYVIGQINSCETNEGSVNQYKSISFSRCNFFHLTVQPNYFLET